MENIVFKNQFLNLEQVQNSSLGFFRPKLYDDMGKGSHFTEDSRTNRQSEPTEGSTTTSARGYRRSCRPGTDGTGESIMGVEKCRTFDQAGSGELFVSGGL